MTIPMGKIEYTYERINNADVIYRKLIGDITAEDIIESFNYLINENKITEDCVGILTNTQDAKFRFSIRKFSRIIHFLKKNEELKRIKLAIIVVTPEKTIFPFLVAKKIKSINIKAFSTTESAYQWLLK